MNFIKLTGVVILAAAVPAAAGKTPEKKKAAVDLYVMSLCPFGVQAENALIPAIRALDGAADLRLHFIANEGTGPDGKTGFSSLHGAPEVEEDMRQVCARDQAPGKYLDYILERNKNVQSQDWQSAAKAAGLDAERVDKCVKGDQGAALLRQDIKAAQDRKANGSPTIDVDGVAYAKPRSTGWFEVVVCDALKAKGAAQPKACAGAQALAASEPAGSAPGGCGDGGGAPQNAKPFAIRIVTEASCPICRPTLADALKRYHPAAKETIVDSESKEGKDLIREHRATSLPLYVLDKAVESEQMFPDLLKVAYYKDGDAYLIRTGPTNYYPSVQLERRRAARHADLFFQSLDPQSAQAEADFARFLMENVDQLKDFSFSVHFVAAEESTDSGKAPAAGEERRAATVAELGRKAGALTARGGPDELMEDARQLCLFQHAPIGSFFNYLACRNKALDDAGRGDACLPNDEKVRACAAGKEGESLLRQDARLARDLGLDFGPALLWENRYGPFPWNTVDWRRVMLGDKEVAAQK